MSGKHDDHGELGHIVPFKVYLNVFIALVILTILTVVAAKWDVMDFGALNIVIALIIASVKAGIVAMYFMHLKYEHPLTWAYAAFPIILLIVLMGGVFIDNPLR